MFPRTVKKITTFFKKPATLMDALAKAYGYSNYDKWLIIITTAALFVMVALIWASFVYMGRNMHQKFSSNTIHNCFITSAKPHNPMTAPTTLSDCHPKTRSH